MRLRGRTFEDAQLQRIRVSVFDYTAAARIRDNASTPPPLTKYAIFGGLYLENYAFPQKIPLGFCS